MRIVSALLILFAIGCSSTRAATPEEKAAAQKVYQSGLSQANGGNSAAAEAFFRQALDLDSSNVNYHIALGGVLLRAGRTADAVKVYQNAMEQVGEMPELYEDLAFAQNQNGDNAAAIESLEKALNLRGKLPDSPENRKWIEQDKKGISDLRK